MYHKVYTYVHIIVDLQDSSANFGLLLMSKSSLYCTIRFKVCTAVIIYQNFCTYKNTLLRSVLKTII